MGVKSLSKYLNQYAAADEASKGMARRLIVLESDLAVDLCAGICRVHFIEYREPFIGTKEGSWVNPHVAEAYPHAIRIISLEFS